MNTKKFGTKRAGTGTVDETLSNSVRWATSAAGQIKASSGVTTLNVKRVPVRYIKEDEGNPRKLALRPAELFRIAEQYPIDRTRLEADEEGYWDEYVERVEHGESLQGRAVSDFQSIAAFAFALKSAERLLHPIVVWQNDTQFHLIAGERRLLAHILLGEASIDAKIRERQPTLFEKYLLQWEENIHRDDLSLYEKLENLRHLMETWKEGRGVQAISVSQFASIAGLARSAAQRYLAVIRCPSPELMEAVAAGRINNIKQAARLAALSPAALAAHLNPPAKTAPKTAATSSIRVGRAPHYRAITFLVNAAVEKLDDEALTASLDSLDLNRQKDLNRAFELLLQRIGELHVDD
jgi:ParB-like chromosome segregation protein Spo0J